MTKWISENFSVAGAIYVALMCSAFAALSLWVSRGRTPKKFRDEHEDAGVG